jgi:hypothetical protein
MFRPRRSCSGCSVRQSALLLVVRSDVGLYDGAVESAGELRDLEPASVTLEALDLHQQTSLGGVSALKLRCRRVDS